MIDFSYSETAGWFGVMFGLILASLSVVFFFVTGLFGFRVMFKKIEPGWFPEFFLGIPFGIIAGLLIAFPGFWTVHKFRSFDLDSVGSLKVKETNEPNGKVFQYSNTAEIQNLLRMMGSCQGVYHQHDELYDGYILEVIRSDRELTNLVLKVYRKSTVKGSRKTVIAQYRGMEAGEFECQPIQNWVATNIDPLYGRRTSF